MMREDIHCMLSYLFNQMTRINVRSVSYACACAKQHIGNCIVDQHFHEKKIDWQIAQPIVLTSFGGKKRVKKREKKKKRHVARIGSLNAD